MKRVNRRLVVASNRLPLSFQINKGAVRASPSSGGLVSALAPILAEHGGVWVGSPGIPSAGKEQDEQIRASLAEASQGNSYEYVPIFLSKEEQANFYEGFSNEVIWPLFHDLQSRCRFLPAYWEFYKRVNRKFAKAIERAAKPGDLIWIQDYQLMEVANVLRRTLPDAELAFFLHIPFPSPDIFEKLPWRSTILESLLEHDLVGVQTMRDERNLISCVRSFLPGAEVQGSADKRRVRFRGRAIRVQHFPISIDFRQFADDASNPAIARRSQEIRQQLGGKHIALGLDRLDYTKGIPERIRAFAALLREYPHLRGKICLYQVVVPSRETITGYRKLMAEVERSVAHVNGEYSTTDWVPIHYVHRSLAKDELLALYTAADTALITPLKDGMNLVAKEYCAARIDNDGVLILSEFAGAAPELGKAALLVNPYDEIGVAAALERAFSMERAERRGRMLRMRAVVRRQDVLHWRDSFFASLPRGTEQMHPASSHSVPERR